MCHRGIASEIANKKRKAREEREKERGAGGEKERARGAVELGVPKDLVEGIDS